MNTHSSRNEPAQQNVDRILKKHRAKDAPFLAAALQIIHLVCPVFFQYPVDVLLRRLIPFYEYSFIFNAVLSTSSPVFSSGLTDYSFGTRSQGF
jgi:hypothetical protein